MKRQLTEEEKKLTEKGIERLQHEMEVGFDYLELYKLTYEKILKRNYEQLLEKYKNLIHDTESMIEVNVKTIEEMKKQISEGVEIKKEKK